MDYKAIRKAKTFDEIQHYLEHNKLHPQEYYRLLINLQTKIREAIHSKHYTQKEIAILLKIQAPKLSIIMSALEPLEGQTVGPSLYLSTSNSKANLEV